MKLNILRFLPLLVCLVIVASPEKARANPELLVADAPLAVPASSSFRPLYLDQLNAYRDKKAAAEKPPTLEHRVARGETLGAIARRYGTTVKDLMAANGLRNAHFIREGQLLVLFAEATPGEATPAKVTHTIRRGDTVWDLSTRYRVSMDAILTENSINDPTRLSIGQKLVIPGAVSPIAASQSQNRPVLASRTVERNAAFVWPTEGYISSGFGPRWNSFHYGIDIAANIGTPTVAIAAGNVTDAGWHRGYGYMVRIDHHNGWVSVYGHSSRLFVKAGQAVQAGQRIASVGQTGNATGPHLHLEMIYQGKYQNPLKYLPAR